MSTTESRQLAPLLTGRIYAVCAVSPDAIRIDIDTEDGGTCSAIVPLQCAAELSRDVSRAVATALRMC